MVRKDQDIQSGVVIILIALALSTQFGKLSFMQSIYPKLLVAAMGLSGVGIIAKAFLALRRTQRAHRVLTLRDFILQAAAPGAFVVILCLLLPTLGFYADAFIVVAGICLLQDFVISGRQGFSARLIARVLLFSAGVTVFLYVVFSVLLKLSTPKGFLGI